MTHLAHPNMLADHPSCVEAESMKEEYYARMTHKIVVKVRMMTGK